MISRRALLSAAASLAAYAALPKTPTKAATANVIAGAVRWDAWYSSTDPSSVSAQNSLSPKQWQFRAPWFSQVQNDYIVRAAGTQANMDTEIQCAANAGLRYWAFDQYSQDNALLTAWNLYQSSTINSQINWCWMAFNDRGYFGSTGNFSTQVTQWVNWFLQPNYQKVLTNRPLVYFDFTSSPAAFGSSDTNFNAMLSALRSACASAGLGNPYIVVCGSYPASNTFKEAIGADAISAYAAVVTTPAQPSSYAQLIAGTEGFWAQMAGSGSAIVPCCLTGWDTRPRKQNPVPWGLGSYAPAYSRLLNYFTAATPSQIAGHIQDAVNYVGANPTKCPSTAILIYSWTECDEGGGCMIPTLGDPPQDGNTTNLLTAISAVLK